VYGGVEDKLPRCFATADLLARLKSQRLRMGDLGTGDVGSQKEFEHVQ